MEDPLLALLDKKKNRLIRVILGTRERLFPDETCPDDGGQFRKVVLDEVNAYFEQVADIVSTLQQDRNIVVNELFLEKLDEFKSELVSEVRVAAQVP